MAYVKTESIPTPDGNGEYYYRFIGYPQWRMVCITCGKDNAIYAAFYAQFNPNQKDNCIDWEKRSSWRMAGQKDLWQEIVFEGSHSLNPQMWCRNCDSATEMQTVKAFYHIRSQQFDLDGNPVLDDWGQPTYGEAEHWTPSRILRMINNKLEQINSMKGRRLKAIPYNWGNDSLGNPTILQDAIAYHLPLYLYDIRNGDSCYTENYDCRSEDGGNGPCSRKD